MRYSSSFFWRLTVPLGLCGAGQRRRTRSRGGARTSRKRSTRRKTIAPNSKKALQSVPKKQRPGIAFLIVNMPAQRSRRRSRPTSCSTISTWPIQIRGQDAVGQDGARGALPQRRPPLRQRHRDARAVAARDDGTVPAAREGLHGPHRGGPGLNAGIFTKLKVRYSILRGRPDQSPSESIKSGHRVVHRTVDPAGRRVPQRRRARPAGRHSEVDRTSPAITPGSRSGTATGTSPAPASTTRTAWTAAGSLATPPCAKKDSIESAIYASSFKRTKTDISARLGRRTNQDVSAENVTDRYTRHARPVGSRCRTRPLSKKKQTRIFEAARDLRFADRQEVRSRTSTTCCSTHERRGPPCGLERVQGLEDRTRT